MACANKDKTSLLGVPVFHVTGEDTWSSMIISGTGEAAGIYIGDGG